MKENISYEIRGLRYSIGSSLSLALYIYADMNHYGFISTLCIVDLICILILSMADYRKNEKKDE